MSSPFLNARTVTPLSGKTFGLLIAFVIPGFIALVGISPLSPQVQAWLAPEPQIPARIEAIVFLALASIAAGLTVSGVRWLIIDTIHHATGLRAPRWDDTRLQSNLDAFDTIVEAHYRHYQFYSNGATALAVAYFVHRFGTSTHVAVDRIDPLFLAVELLFLVVSRDTLAKYYARTSRLLGPLRNLERSVPHGKRQPPEAVAAEARIEGQEGCSVGEEESLTNYLDAGG